jgi:hypothetical protein
VSFQFLENGEELMMQDAQGIICGIVFLKTQKGTKHKYIIYSLSPFYENQKPSGPQLYPWACVKDQSGFCHKFEMMMTCDTVFVADNLVSSSVEK